MGKKIYCSVYCFIYQRPAAFVSTTLMSISGKFCNNFILEAKSFSSICSLKSLKYKNFFFQFLRSPLKNEAPSIKKTARTLTLSLHSKRLPKIWNDFRPQTLSPIFGKHQAAEILVTASASANENCNIVDTVPGPSVDSTLPNPFPSATRTIWSFFAWYRPPIRQAFWWKSHEFRSSMP